MKEDNSEFDAQISNLRDVFRGFMYIGNVSASDKAQKILKKNGWELISIVPYSIHIDQTNGAVSYLYPIKIKKDTTNHVAYLVIHVEPDKFTWLDVAAKPNVSRCIVRKEVDVFRLKLEKSLMETQARVLKRGIKKCTRKKATKATTRCLISNSDIRKIRCTMEKLGCIPEPSGKKLTSKQDDKKIVKAFKKRK
jgi:hypothetical protein